jgi:hypothetical protein
MKDLIPNRREIAKRIAPYGDIDRGIRKSKPDDNGLIQFVWRFARFHSGDDMHMPMTAYFWLQDFLDDNYIDASVTGIHDEKGKEILDLLDDVVTDVLRNEFEIDDTTAARHWSASGLISNS